MDNMKNELDRLASAGTLMEAADIAETLERLGTNESYPTVAKVLRRFALETPPKRPRWQTTPRIHSDQQIFDASLAGNWDGITEQGLLEAVTAALSPSTAASFAASRLAEMNPTYAVLPRIVTPWGKHEPVE